MKFSKKILLFSALVLGGLFLLIAFTEATPLFAQGTNTPTVEEAATETARSTTCGVNCYIQWIIANVFSFLLEIFGYLIATLVGILIPIGRYNAFVDAPAVKVGWDVVRDISNMFFVLVLLVISFGTILHLEQYPIKKMLPKVLLMAILVNFSKTIAGLIIDFSQVVTLTFVAAYQQTGAGNFIQALGLTNLTHIAGKADGAIPQNAITTAAIAGAYFVALIYAVISLVVILAYIVIFVIRIVALWLLIIFSPFAYVLSVVPMGQKYASMWWDYFAKYVIIGPVLAFFLWLSLATLPHVGETTRTAFDGDNAETTVLGQIPAAVITESGQPLNLFNFVISIAMLMISLVFAQQMGGAVGKTAGFAYGQIATGGKKFAKGAGRAAVGTALYAPRKLANSERGQGYIRSTLLSAAGSRIPGVANLAIRMQQARGSAERKQADEAEKFAKTLSPDFAKAYVVRNRSSVDPAKKARIDAIKKRMPHLVPDTKATAPEGKVELEKSLSQYGKKDWKELGPREAQRLMLRAMDEGIDPMDSPGLQAVRDDNKEGDWHQFIADAYGARAGVYSMPTFPHGAPPIPGGRPIPDLSKKFRRSVDEDDQEYLAQVTEKAMRDRGLSEDEFYEAGGAYNTNPSLYLSRDQYQNHKKAKSQASTSGAISADVVNVQGGEIRLPGDSGVQSKGDEAARYVATQQAIARLMPQFDNDETKASEQFFRTQYSSSPGMYLDEEAYRAQPLKEAAEARQNNIDDKEYDVTLGNFKNYMPLTPERAAREANMTPEEQAKFEHLRNTQPDRIRLGADFAPLGLDSEALGINLKGDDKQKMVSKVMKLMRKQFQGKYSDEEFGQIERTLQNATSLHLLNRRKPQSLREAIDTASHEDMHDKLDAVDQTKLGEIYEAIPAEEKAKIRNALQVNWGIGKDDASTNEAMHEYFAEFLKNAVGQGESKAKYNKTKEVIAAKYGNDQQRFYASDEYKQDQANRKAGRPSQFATRGELIMTEAMDGSDEMKRKFAQLGVIEEVKDSSGTVTGYKATGRSARSFASGRTIPRQTLTPEPGPQTRAEERAATQRAEREAVETARKNDNTFKSSFSATGQRSFAGSAETLQRDQLAQARAEVSGGTLGAGAKSEALKHIDRAEKIVGGPRDRSGNLSATAQEELRATIRDLGKTTNAKAGIGQRVGDEFDAASASRDFHRKFNDMTWSNIIKQSPQQAGARMEELKTAALAMFRNDQAKRETIAKSFDRAIEVMRRGGNPAMLKTRFETEMKTVEDEVENSERSQNVAAHILTRSQGIETPRTAPRASATPPPGERRYRQAVADVDEGHQASSTSTENVTNVQQTIHTTIVSQANAVAPLFSDANRSALNLIMGRLNTIMKGQKMDAARTAKLQPVLEKGLKSLQKFAAAKSDPLLAKSFAQDKSGVKAGVSERDVLAELGEAVDSLEQQPPSNDQR